MLTVHGLLLHLYESLILRGMVVEGLLRIALHADLVLVVDEIAEAVEISREDEVWRQTGLCSSEHGDKELVSVLFASDELSETEILRLQSLSENEEGAVIRTASCSGLTIDITRAKCSSLQRSRPLRLQIERTSFRCKQ